MEKKNNIFLGVRITKRTISIASLKKYRRSRKLKFEVGRPKQGLDNKKKDMKKKRKTKRTQIAKLREELSLIADEIRATNQQLDEFRLMLSERRVLNRKLKEFNAEINAKFFDQLNDLG